jgi:glycosyltransferase involved in cell wall biosynthesis
VRNYEGSRTSVSYWISVMKCHFVYAVPLKSGIGITYKKSKLFRKLSERGFWVNLFQTRQPDHAEMATWPARHPATVTRYLYSALGKKIPTVLYHLTERSRCNFSPDDIFVGHPFFPHSKGGYGVTEMAAKERVRPKKFTLIVPLHCDTSIGGNHINKDFLLDIEGMLPKVDLIFAIMGEYWWDKWDQSPFSHWKPKMIRLDMAVDAIGDFPRIKKRFNKPGCRGFLYIGNNEPRKGTDFLGDLMSHFPNCRKGWIGPGEDIPNVKRISNDRPLGPAFMATLADDYDFFISPSRVDPNPTTILQSMAWGFPVISTPQSGYYETSYRRHIYLDDMQKSVSVLQELQHADESKLAKMADEGRAVVLANYNWEKFTSTVLGGLGL